MYIMIYAMGRSSAGQSDQVTDRCYHSNEYKYTRLLESLEREGRGKGIHFMMSVEHVHAARTHMIHKISSRPCRYIIHTSNAMHDTVYSSTHEG